MIRRKKRMAHRKRDLRPKKPINKVNRKRKAKRTLQYYGPKARREWMLLHACLVCFRGPVEQAHAKGAGAGLKGNADKIIPLCNYHHIHTLHRMPVADFERLYSVELSGHTLLWWAEFYDKAWKQFKGEAA